MGYNVLSGSTSMVSWTASGSFEGDGAGLENVIQFPTQNASATRIPLKQLTERPDLMLILIFLLLLQLKH